MYNYFMLIGVVEGYCDLAHYHIKLKVTRDFGYGYDVFEIKFIGGLNPKLKEKIRLGERIVVKGRMVQLDSKIELIGEQIIFFQEA